MLAVSDVVSNRNPRRNVAPVRSSVSLRPCPVPESSAVPSKWPSPMSIFKCSRANTVGVLASTASSLTGVSLAPEWLPPNSTWPSREYSSVPQVAPLPVNCVLPSSQCQSVSAKKGPMPPSPALAWTAASRLTSQPAAELPIASLPERFALGPSNCRESTRSPFASRVKSSVVSRTASSSTASLPICRRPLCDHRFSAGNGLARNVSVVSASPGD